MTPSILRILVTGVEGDFGQALVKALRLCQDPLEIYGCDVEGAGIGSAFVDRFYQVPYADAADYLNVLDGICQSHEIQAVVPGSEQEIAVLSGLGSPPKLPGGAVVVCQEAAWIETYGDKLRCMEALEGKVELACFADGSDSEAVARLIAQVGFPVVVKSRKSSGSRTLRIAHNQDELATYLSGVPLPLAQQYIDDEGGEFSIGLFAGRQSESAIAFRRQLGGPGLSWFAEKSDDLQVLTYSQLIGKVIRLQGSANVQVRKSGLGVRLLEINPRFSSLAAARAICGFRDVEWSVNMALGREIALPPASDYRWIRFRRFYHEVVDLGDGFQAVAEWCPRKSGK